MLTGGLGHSFCCCDKTPGQKQLGLKGFRFEDTVRPAGEGTEAGAGVSGSHHIHTQEAEREGYWSSAQLLLFIQFRTLAQGMVLPTFRVGLSLPVNLVSLTDMPRGLSP